MRGIPSSESDARVAESHKRVQMWVDDFKRKNVGKESGARGCSASLRTH